MEMKNLGNLKPAKGSNTAPKRLGRGIGSGLGKTSGKGHKGQTARKGGHIAPGFEGGQMPLYRRLPKRGFTNRSRVSYNPVNLDSLERFDGAQEVTPEMMAKAGLLRFPNEPVKLLGNGALKKPLKIRVHKVSEKAKAAVESAGGQVAIITVERKPVVKNKMRSSTKR